MNNRGAICWICWYFTCEETYYIKTILYNLFFTMSTNVMFYTTIYFLIKFMSSSVEEKNFVSSFFFVQQRHLRLCKVKLPAKTTWRSQSKFCKITFGNLTWQKFIFRQTYQNLTSSNLIYHLFRLLTAKSQSIKSIKWLRKVTWTLPR